MGLFIEGLSPDVVMAAFGGRFPIWANGFINESGFINEEFSMASTKGLREKRGTLHAQMQEIINRSEAEDRDLNSSEKAELERLLAEDKALKNRIEVIEAQNERDRELSQIVDPFKPGNQGQAWSGGVVSHDHQATDAAVFGFTLCSAGKPVPDHISELAARGGYRPGQSTLEIALNTTSGRPVLGRNYSHFGPSGAMTTRNPGKGGAWVPDSFLSSLEHGIKTFGPMTVTSSVLVTETGGDLTWPTVDDTLNVAVPVAELEEAPEIDIETGATKFGAHEYTSGTVIVSQAMLDDAGMDLASEIGRMLGTRIGRGLNRDFTTGDSPNRPRGILHSVPVGKTTSSSTALTADEIIDLVATVDPGYRNSPGVGFMMSPAIFAVISKLKSEADGNYLIGNMQDGTEPKLRGYPVFLNPDMPDQLVAGNKVILFGDLSAYKIRQVRQIFLRRLDELYARQNATGFVAFLRVDGGLLDPGTNPIKALRMKP